MLHITDILGVFPLLWCLMLLVCCYDVRRMATGCMGEKYPCVNWCLLYILCSIIPWRKCIYGHCCQCICWVKLLPFIGCNCDLVAKLWQISVTRDAVMSHCILLCCVVKPPMWQTMAWHTVNVAAQLHVWEVFVRLHSYLKHSESQNSLFVKVEFIIV